MTPQQFLKAVWPEEGHYCVAIPGDVGYRHFVRGSIDKIVRIVEQYKDTQNIFFCVHALKSEQGVFDPQKLNRVTGELGAHKKRDQRNMRAAKCFFFDLDVGESTPVVPKYATQQDALRGLIEFCNKVKFPKPMIVSSGGGLHVYWLLTDEIESDEWQTHATKLRAVASHHGLRFDPARVVDSSSILRVAGTFNHKKGAKRDVVVYANGVVTPTGEFIKLLDDAVVRTGVTVRETPRYARPAVAPIEGLEDNTSDNDTGLPPPPEMSAVVKACGMVQELIRRKEEYASTEPVWHKVLNLFRFVENGRHFCHKWSEACKEKYDHEKTEEYLNKLDAVRFEGGKKMGPTICATLVEVVGTDKPCEGCAFASKRSSPIHAARFHDVAPAPVISVKGLGDVQIDIKLPPPPDPFKRLKTGIAMSDTSKDGKDIEFIIYENDLYPVQRVVNKETKTEQLVWAVKLPREDEKRFTLDAEALYDRQKFTRTISNCGIYPKTANIQHVQDYMIAYIKQLQREADADRQMNHLGWADETFSEFILPDRLIGADGKSRPVSISKAVSASTRDIYKAGTLERQLELLRFFTRKEYAPHVFHLMGSLAAPMFHATGHSGCVVHGWGETAASKSTALYTGASFWGHPKNLPMNGTKRGATENARMERINILSNLPVFVDEITFMRPEDAHTMAIGISQPGSRIRSKNDGTEQERKITHKATVMLTTGNSSLHGLLSMDNTAGTASSMRVVEVLLKKQLVHKKWEAEDYMIELTKNFGHVGEIFLTEMMRDRTYEQRVRQLDREISAAAHLSGAERFQGSLAAAVIAATEKARKIGLLDFDPELLKRWFLTEQVNYNRSIITQEYAASGDVLSSYLDSIDGKILVTQRVPGSGGKDYVDVLREPHGEMLAHFDMSDGIMYVSKHGWKAYCQRIGANPIQTLKELADHRDSNNYRLILNTNYHKTMGVGTNFAKLQSWVFVINMRHEEVANVSHSLGMSTKNFEGGLSTAH